MRLEDSPSALGRNGDGANSLDVHLGIYLRQLGPRTVLTLAEESKLASRIQAGDTAAREQLILSNLRLVVKIALGFRGYGLPILDLISEGNLGLMKAADRFDPGRGAKFGTYAAWWIKQHMRRALANQGRTIRLPGHLVDQINRMNHLTATLSEALGRTPSDAEIGEEIGLTPHQIDRLRGVARQVVPLDAPLHGTMGESLANQIPDENSASPEEELDRRTELEMLSAALRSLTQREIKVLVQRFGLKDSKRRTLEEVGNQLRLTRERVRQIQQEALKKLRRRLRESSISKTCCK